MKDQNNYFGAKKLNLNDLIPAQQNILKFILNNIWEHAQSIPASKKAKETYYDRPRNVYMISGARGMGKTSLLLTLHNILDSKELSNEEKDFTSSFSSKIETDDQIFKTVFTLPILRPDEMEGSDNTMECIFSHISDHLESEIKNKKNAGEDQKKRSFCEYEWNLMPGDAESLVEYLQLEVQIGWTYSHECGLENLSRDSVDYKDYVKNRADQARKSYTRVKAWREFVDKFLDHIKAKVLVLCIDDTDLTPMIGKDILHAIRIYLCHPRIITLLSVDMDYLRHGQQLIAAENRFKAVKGISDKQNITDWNNFDNRHIEEYFYKILPVHYRKELKLDLLAIDQITHCYKSDYKSFRAYLIDTIKIDKAMVNNFVRWWFLGHDPLALFNSIRDLQIFIRNCQKQENNMLEDYIFQRPALWKLQKLVGKLNPDIIAQIIENGQLEYLWHKSLFILKDEQFGSGSDEYMALTLLLDHEIADKQFKPYWPDSIMPALSGMEKLTDAFPPEFKEEAIGLSRTYHLRNTFVPLNCIYFSDLLAMYSQINLTSLEEGFALIHDDISWKGWLESALQKKPYIKENNFDSDELFEQLSIDSDPKWLKPGVPIDGHYLYPRLWLIHNICEKKKALSNKDVVSTILEYNKAIGTISDEKEFTKFKSFLQYVKYFYDEKIRTKQEYAQAMPMSMSIAMPQKKIDPSKLIYQTVEFFKKESDLKKFNEEIFVRTPLLLAWAIAPILKIGILAGVPEQELKNWKNAISMINKFLSLIKVNPEYLEGTDFLDLPQNKAKKIFAMTVEHLKEIQDLLNKADHIIPKFKKDWESWDYKQQLAYLMRVSPYQVEKFLEIPGPLSDGK